MFGLVFPAASSELAILAPQLHGIIACQSGHVKQERLPESARKPTLPLGPVVRNCEKPRRQPPPCTLAPVPVDTPVPFITNSNGRHLSQETLYTELEAFAAPGSERSGWFASKLNVKQRISRGRQCSKRGRRFSGADNVKLRIEADFRLA